MNSFITFLNGDIYTNVLEGKEYIARGNKKKNKSVPVVSPCLSRHCLLRDQSYYVFGLR